MSWFSAIQTFIDCPTKCFQLIHPWSERLLLILCFGNHNFFLFKHQTNQVILESDASAFFFLWVSTDTHISSVVDRPIHCWIVIRQCPSYSITLWVLPLIHNAFGKLYPLLGQPCSAFELVYLLLKLVVYVTKMPDELNLCLPLIRENPKVFTSHTLPVFCQIKFQHYSFIKARGEWNDMH